MLLLRHRCCRRSCHFSPFNVAAVADAIGTVVDGADHDAVADFVSDAVFLDVAFCTGVNTGVGFYSYIWIFN